MADKPSQEPKINRNIARIDQPQQRHQRQSFGSEDGTSPGGSNTEQHYHYHEGPRDSGSKDEVWDDASASWIPQEEMDRRIGARLRYRENQEKVEQERVRDKIRDELLRAQLAREAQATPKPGMDTFSKVVVIAVIAIAGLMFLVSTAGSHKPEIGDPGGPDPAAIASDAQANALNADDLAKQQAFAAQQALAEKVANQVAQQPSQNGGSNQSDAEAIAQGAADAASGAADAAMGAADDALAQAREAAQAAANQREANRAHSTTGSTTPTQPN